MGEYFKDRLIGLQGQYSFIKEVRGKGLILGMELSRNGTEIVNQCLERGFLINCTMDRILRFIPPLIITEKAVDSLVNALGTIFMQVKKEK